MIWYAKGQLELVWGKSDKAREFFTSSIQVADSAEARYMLGLILEDEYQPAEALKEFEKCLELDPAGELSVPALREANAMKNYRKKFRGSWPLFILLLFFPFPIVFGVLYFVAKRK